MKLISALFYFVLLLVNFTNGQVVNKGKDTDLLTVSRARLLLNLSNLNQETKTLDSVAVKIFVKIEIANFIWKRKISEGQDFAESLMEEAIRELQTRKAEIPILYLNAFQTDITSSLKANSPDFFQKISKKYNLEVDGYAQSYDLVSKHGKNGISKAIEQVKKSLSSLDTSSNPVGVVFIIEELLAQNKITEANSILESILTSVEKSATNSYELFLYLNERYVSQTTPIDLQKRFLKFAIAAGQSALQKPSVNSLDSEKRQNIYQILKYNILKIQTILPSEFPQALAITDSLRKSLTNAFKEREEINDRINQAKDKLSQAISEAERAEDKSLKNDLWEQAADLALKKKKFRLAVDCLEKIESNDEEFLSRHDQFLDEDVTASALKENDLNSAEYAISKIKSKLRSGLATLQIVKFHYQNKDKLNAQLTLNESIKKIDATENDSQKIRGLSEVLNLAFIVDKERLFDITQSVVKTVNSLPSPNDDEKPESELRKKYVNDVEMVTAWNLFPAFLKLAKNDSAFARNITSDFTEQKYRVITSVAAEIGAFEAENMNKQIENKKITSK